MFKDKFIWFEFRECFFVEEIDADCREGWIRGREREKKDVDEFDEIPKCGSR